MKNLLATLAAFFAFTSMAAATDLPRRTTSAIAPVPAAESLNNWYVGGNVGGAINSTAIWNESTPSVGAVAGFQFHRNLAAEVTYDYFWQRNGVESGQTAFFNGVANYRIPNSIFTPYVLAGVGYGWDQFGDRSLYNVGAGLRAQVTRSMEFDLRYRYMDNWDNNNRANVVTGGINYKF